ncbi:DUF6119 family protein [Pedobacter ureilyticus]|uniref:DUF6119 family protein n=1 Tax=Pedobacter ureilyticus TaxID=1393051 RepID=A0ABW9JA95_9SPHI|nr:DUF6119 family protein [Pedobacter helvus]
MEEELKNLKLAIYLIKEEYKDYTKVLKDSISYQTYKFKDEMEVEGAVLIGKEKSSEPNWKSLLQEGVSDKLPDLHNTSNRALAFFVVNGRIFAIPFGYGKHLLEEESIDREFGLKTALNVINADKLISVDKANVGDLSLLTKTQASKKGTPDLFNIDVIRDLLKGITGERSMVLSEEFGSAITGGEGLYLSPRTNIKKIPGILARLETEYRKDTYKDRFDWIDNIKTEKDPGVIDILKGKLIADMRTRNVDSLHLAPPFIIKWEELEYVSYSPKGELYNGFEIEDFYAEKSTAIDIADWDWLQRQKIYVKLSTFDEPYAFYVWRFINYQVESGSNHYVFTLFNWYKVNPSYYREMYDYCSKISESKTVFIPCEKSYDEGEYNSELADSDGNLMLFDKKMVKSEISRSGIEVCDVFNVKEKEFIHVKFRNSSATLSHLFAQGRIAGNSLRRDRHFRVNLRAKLKADKDLVPIENKDFSPGDYTITYAIIESKKRKFVDALPFFSLVNFRLTAEELQVMGFKVRVKNIQII